MGQKAETELLPKVSRQKRETVSREVSREHSVLEDKEGQKDKMAYCYDKDTENKCKQFCI